MLHYRQRVMVNLDANISRVTQNVCDTYKYFKIHIIVFDETITSYLKKYSVLQYRI